MLAKTATRACNKMNLLRKGKMMSEQEVERVLFEDLSAELEDPALQRSLDQARRWDEKLRVGGEDGETLRAAIRVSLGRSWSQWMDKPVTVTGYAHRVLDGGTDIRPDPVLMTPDDDVVSKGFSIVYTDVDGENIHGNPYGAQYRVVHDMRRCFDGKRYEQLVAFIDNHDVQSDVMSVEYAKRWLGRTQIDYLSQLQASTEKARRPETKLVRVGTSCEPGLFLDVFNRKNRAAVEAYVNDLVEVDTEVPYIFTTLNGASVFEEKSGGKTHTTITAPVRAMARLSKVYLQEIEPSATNNGAGDWWLSVRAKVYGEKVADASRTVILPLRSLKNVRSLREFGYGALQHLDEL